MTTAEHYDWLFNKQPKKEHVSLQNFVIKFGFTDQKSTNEAYLLLIISPRIRESRRTRLQDAFKLFKQRNETKFWESRNLKTADHRLLVNSATIAKKTGIIIQETGFQEASSGLKRYASELLDVEPLEVNDDPDDESELDEGAESPVQGEVTAQGTVDELEDGGEALDFIEVLGGQNKKGNSNTSASANTVLNLEVDDPYEFSELDDQPSPDQQHL
ncbi:hypothetical protein BGZ83_001892 [Gryganskiella cystojenkinii]|nr:hypothetical protein BGZ83_001892 [Gryganskiella cystojenkinii]